MIVTEIGIQRFVTRTAYVAPFTFSFTVNIQKLAYFWLMVFGCDDETTDERIYVLSVIANYTERFSKVISLAECINTAESWIFDWDAQKLYINFGLDFHPLYTPVEYLRAIGFCDTSVIYVDDTAFLPVVSSAPSIKQKQDLIGYDKLAFNTGSISLANESGVLDFMRAMSLFNNDVALYYLKYDGRSEYTRDELVPLAWFLLEDVDIGKTAGKITLMDVRKSWSRKIPTHLFNATEYPDIDDDLIDKPVPLLFGEKTVPAYCTNGDTTTGNVIYRVSEELTSITRVYKIVDDAEVDVTTTATDLPNGSFTVSGTDGRDGDGNVLELFCECTGTLDSGESFASPLGVLKWIEAEYNNAAFTDSFFDTTEISAEIGALEPVCLYTAEEQIEISELVRQMQEGSSNRFRYELNPEGKRTARLDDPERESSLFVAKEEILENDQMNIYTDKSTIAATVKINWGQDGITEKYKTVVDTSQESAVAQNARERPEMEFDTFLLSRAHAVTRAALEASRLGQIRRFTDCTLRGERFLTMRIYDIITAELVDETREWMGVWTCQVLAIAPDTDNEQNKVTLLLVERIADIDEGETLRVTTTGAIRKTTTDDDDVRVTK
jgi:hypothetical protein